MKKEIEEAMTVQKLIDELNKITDKTQKVYCDIYNDKPDTLLPICSVYETQPVGNNVNLATYYYF